MAQYLLDTNHVTYLLQRHAAVLAQYQNAVLREDEILLSPVVYYEVLRGIRESQPDAGLRRQAEQGLRLLIRNWRRLVWASGLQRMLQAYG